jgi:hypothetical protein
MRITTEVLVAIIADGFTFREMDFAVTTTHHIFYRLWGCRARVLFRPEVPDYPIYQ